MTAFQILALQSTLSLVAFALIARATYSLANSSRASTTWHSSAPSRSALPSITS